MQSVSGTLATALTSDERSVIARMKADWTRDASYAYDPGIVRDVLSDTIERAGDIGDLTQFLVSVTVDRSLSTELPDGARLGSGFGAAQATITLAGDLTSGIGIVRALTGYGGTGASMRRAGTPIYVEMGAVGTAGPEYVRQFTGRIRSVDLDPFAGTVTLTALDGREKIRNPLPLPLYVGTTAKTFMDAVAAASFLTITYTEQPLNTGVTTPIPETSDPWTMLQELAAAEQGVILFDENDTLRFYNRYHMVGGAAVDTLTVASDTFSNLKALQSSESVDTVINYVTVPASTADLDPAGTLIWTLSELLVVDTWSTLEVAVEFPGPVWAISGTNYLAAKASDGTGGDVANLQISYSQRTATGWTMSIWNPNGFPSYIVANSTQPTYQGQPWLSIVGQCIRPAVDSYIAFSSDIASRAYWGTQTLDVPSNIWRQSNAAASALAAYLVSVLKDPHPTLSGVSVVGDPRRQLADRVRVVEPDGLSLDGDFWLIGISTSFSASDGLAQSVTLRQA